MTANKFVVKCGNFAVLVDLHVLPRGSGKDTSWFSDHEKEEVCMLLKDPIDARVKQFVEARKQQGQLKHKEFTQCNPLILKGDRFRIAAYFMKRWVNLRCILKRQYRELRIFPYRFVVCASLQEPALIPWTNESSTLTENIASGTSEYFVGCPENGKTCAPPATQRQQVILKGIIKKTKKKEGKFIKPLARKVPHGSVDFKHAHQKSEDETPSDDAPEAQCSSGGKPKESSLEPPISELECYADQMYSDDASNQHKPHTIAGLKTELFSKKLPCSSESELPDTKQGQGIATTQHKRRRQFSDEHLAISKKAAYGRDSHMPTGEVIIQKNSVECSMQTLDPNLYRQDLTKPTSIEKVLPRPVSPSSVEQTYQNKPILANEEFASTLKSPHLKTKLSPSGMVLPENIKKVKNQPRKLKLQRNKK